MKCKTKLAVKTLQLLIQVLASLILSLMQDLVSLKPSLRTSKLPTHTRTHAHTNTKTSAYIHTLTHTHLYTNTHKHTHTNMKRKKGITQIPIFFDFDCLLFIMSVHLSSTFFPTIETKSKHFLLSACFHSLMMLTIHS